MLRELSILAIFITANIVTWQERPIHFLTKQYASKHILDIQWSTICHEAFYTGILEDFHFTLILGIKGKSILRLLWLLLTLKSLPYAALVVYGY